MVNINQIYGNTDSVKNTTLEELKTLYDTNFERDELVPFEIYEMICRHSEKLNREIAVYINRKGTILGVAIGDDKKVSLPEMKGRATLNRLSGIRCIHTHPKASGRLSDVDLGTLINLRLDAMIAIGLADGSIYAGTLERDEQGALKNTSVSGAYFMKEENTALNSIFQTIEEVDREAGEYFEVNEEESERAILVGITNMESLEELQELANTAGAAVVETVLQKKDRADSALFIGRGKAEELSLMRQALGANLIIFDDELSGAQARNLEMITGAKVVDRTTLILDIFAQRARSTEGKLQVELAQMKYMLPRLVGKGLSMSRLGGGIGTRGPGETQLETDRRHINRRIKSIENQLEEVKKRRGELRNARKRNSVPTASLAGYTNAGKSTIMNYLCPAAEVFAENMLFATLDSTVRKLGDPSDLSENATAGREALLVDTVGFIRKLPHDLVDAFRSTLEETIYADLILHVVDASNENFSEHMKVAGSILNEIGATTVPIFLVFNKIDMAEEEFSHVSENCEKIFYVSAKTGQGMKELAEAVFEKLFSAQIEATFLVPFSAGGVLSALHNTGGVQSAEYVENGVLVKALVSSEIAGRYKEYYHE